jgi:hypothetical protein
MTAVQGRNIRYGSIRARRSGYSVSQTLPELGLQFLVSTRSKMCFHKVIWHRWVAELCPPVVKKKN